MPLVRLQFQCVPGGGLLVSAPERPWYPFRMGKKQIDDQFSDEETARRRDDVIRRMANTPPKPHSAMKIGKHKAKSGLKEKPPTLMKRIKK